MRILVVDDDSGIGEVLSRGFHYEGYTVDVAASGEQGLVLAGRRRPDLIIVDLMLPGLDGFEVCRRLRQAYGRLPILMLTARDTPTDEVQGLDQGADDYVVKPFVFEVLLARVRALLRRVDSTGPQVLRYGDPLLEEASRQARRGERSIELTTTEYELGRFFLHSPERVLARGLIMERVWGYEFEGNDNVLEVCVRYLRTKREARGEARLIQTVYGAGYVLRDQE